MNDPARFERARVWTARALMRGAQWLSGLAVRALPPSHPVGTFWESTRSTLFPTLDYALVPRRRRPPRRHRVLWLSVFSGAATAAALTANEWLAALPLV